MRQRDAFTAAPIHVAPVLFHVPDYGKVPDEHRKSLVVTLVDHTVAIGALLIEIDTLKKELKALRRRKR